MHESVRAIFPAFSVQFEGRHAFMYLDIKGLVTTGIGNLIDPRDAALALPWRWREKPGAKRPGELATQIEIRAEWDRIKADTSLAARGWRAAERAALLALDAETIDSLVARKLAFNDGRLQRYFPQLAQWPADAQLALHSMAWAMGADFLAPRPDKPRPWSTFRNACDAMAFSGAAEACGMRESDNPGVVARNAADRLLFGNAAATVADGGDRAVLRYQIGDQHRSRGFDRARFTALQKALNARGMADPLLTVDGIWGPRTEEAADRFRAANALPAAEGPSEDLARALGV